MSFSQENCSIDWDYKNTTTVVCVITDSEVNVELGGKSARLVCIYKSLMGTKLRFWVALVAGIH